MTSVLNAGLLSTWPSAWTLNLGNTTKNGILVSGMATLRRCGRLWRKTFLIGRGNKMKEWWLVWKNYNDIKVDGFYYLEDLEKTLTEIKKKAEENNYGFQVLAIINGKRFGYKTVERISVVRVNDEPDREERK
jgi:hypothetical protein